MPSQPTVDLLFSFTHWQNKTQLSFFSKGPFFLYNWITVWKVYKTWFFFQISNLELSYYVEIPSKTWCIFQHSRSKWKEKLLTYSSLNTSKEQQNYDVKIRAYFSLYNLGWWRDVKLSFYDGSNTSLPHWGVKIDTVWPDQVASVYEWVTEKEKELFPFCIYSESGWWSISLSSLEKYPQGIFSLKKTPQLLKEYLMYLQLGTLDFGVQLVIWYRLKRKF